MAAPGKRRLQPSSDRGLEKFAANEMGPLQGFVSRRGNGVSPCRVRSLHRTRQERTRGSCTPSRGLCQPQAPVLVLALGHEVCRGPHEIFD
jgi:hypothetical protein